MHKIGQNIVCAVIPAAGRSSRMGSFKPLLKFNEGITFIEKIVIEFLDFECDEIVVVVNEEIYNSVWNDILSKFEPKVSVIINNSLDLERFYSIKLGLSKLKNKHTCFIHNCDNPFINQNILTSIFKNRTPDGYVKPTFNNHGGHPILISEPIINRIIQSTENDANFRDVLNSFPSKKINIETKAVLTNINNQLEYQRFVESNSIANLGEEYL